MVFVLGGGWVLFLMHNNQRKRKTFLAAKNTAHACSFKAIYSLLPIQNFSADVFERQKDNTQSPFVPGIWVLVIVVESNFPLNCVWTATAKWLKAHKLCLSTHFNFSCKWRGHLHIQLLLLLWWRVPHLLWNRWKLNVAISELAKTWLVKKV